MSNTPLEVFTEAWAAEFRDQINRSESYRRHGASWYTPIALEMSFRGGETRTVILDLSGGRCHDARCAEPSEARELPLVVSASVHNWQSLLTGSLEPIWALMSGQLSLARGSLTELIPHAAAAKALVDAAARLHATFPPEAGP